MNRFRVRVASIEGAKELRIVEFVAGDIRLRMMSLELSQSLHVGDEAVVGFNPTHVAIAKDFSGTISLSNRIEGRVAKIESGDVLVALEIECRLGMMEGIMTKKSLERMELKVGDSVCAMIKASELFLADEAGVGDA